MFFSRLLFLPDVLRYVKWYSLCAYTVQIFLYLLWMPHFLEVVIAVRREGEIKSQLSDFILCFFHMYVVWGE